MNTTMRIEKLFDLSRTVAAKIFEGRTYPWEVLREISGFILELGPTLGDDYICKDGNIWIAKDAKIAPTASITGPCIIDSGAEIRHCAFIRGSAVIGKNCVVGNSVEVKNAILFDGAQVPHFNYVGDSILGWRAHMGAGAVTSNVKSDKTNVSVTFGDAKYATGLRKFGAMLGDNVEVGCNSVLCPGSVIGRNATVYPLSRVRGYVGENHIFKSPDNIVKKIDKEV